MNKSQPNSAATRLSRREIQAIQEEAAAWIARRDAGLTDFEQEQYNLWCDAHPANREALQQLDGVWLNLDRPLQSGAADLLLGELQVRTNRRRHRRVGLAASAAVVLFAATVGWQYWSRPASVASPTSTQAVVHLPAVRSLPDGSVMELADNSDVAVEFSPTFRRVVLKRGQAHFQVSKNPARPFIVAAGGIEVRAVGTAFVVQLGSQDLAVLVTEGRVAVDATAPAAPAAVPSVVPTVLAMVDAGRGVSISLAEADHNKVRPLSEGEFVDRTAWRRPRLEFSGTPLLEAVAMMNRQNQVQLLIEDPAVGQLRISGIFGAQNTDSFVRSLENTFDLKAERRSENEIVLRRAP
jgi:transmembrane sensor